MSVATSSSARKLSQILISSAIQRCRLSGNLCRLSISLKCFHDSNPPCVQISISDTGVGSSLVEFQDLDFQSLSLSTDNWDGVLSITTTGIRDKDIHHYYLNLKEAISSRTRLKNLPSKRKTMGTFSGTEICLSTMEEENVNDFIAWMVRFIRKILVLKTPNITMDLLVEHVDNFGSRCDHILQAIDDFDLTLTMPTIKCLVSGLEDHVLKHGNVVHKQCHSCFANRDHLYVGSGLASNTDNIRGAGQTVEAVIVIAPVSSQPCCWSMNCLTSQVMYFQDFTSCSISQPALHALTSIDWQNYGLRLRGNFVDGDDITVLEWEDNPFARMDIALHIYHKIVTLVPSRQRIPADRKLVKKAVKIALDDVKAKYGGIFLSTHALKIRKHAPELSRTIAKLITSSNDLDFQSECATFLGLHQFDAGREGVVESCIREKIIGIIETNDRKSKAERDAAPSLFKSECLCEEDCVDEENEDAAEDVSILDF